MRKATSLLAISMALVAEVYGQNIAIDWAKFHLSLIPSARFGPTRVSRADHIWATAMYDTWAHNDDVALPSVARSFERTNWSDEELETALHYAAYQAVSGVYGVISADIQAQIDARMNALGFNPISTSTDVSTPEGFGNSVGLAVVMDRADDGANSEGDMKGPSTVRYSDYTNYAPTLPPMPELGKADCSVLPTLARWQPARTRDRANPDQTVVQVWGDVQWTNTRPFSLVTPSEFRVGAPPLPGTLREGRFLRSVRDLLAEFATLSHRDRAQAFYWQSGLKGYSPTGHLADKAVDSAVISNLDLEQSIKLFLIHSASQLDTMIAQFEGKRFFDPPRPTTPVQCLFAGQTIQSWRGPYLGVGSMDGSDWRAYLDEFTVQNGTPEYPCGHCSISGASSEALRLFYNDDTFRGFNVTIAAGSIPLERRIDDPSDPGFIDGLTNVASTGPTVPGYVPGEDVVLSWNTWTESAQSGGRSRILLGVHWEFSNKIAQKMGRRISNRVFNKANALFEGRPFMVPV